MTSSNQFACFKHTHTHTHTHTHAHFLKKRKKRKRTYSRVEEGMSFCSYTFGLALSTSSKERGYVCLSRKEWLMEQKMLVLDFFFFAQQAKNREERNQCSPKLIK